MTRAKTGRPALAAAIALALLGLTGCGSGGGDDPPPPRYQNVGAGRVSITSARPTATTAYLDGTAFISPTWWRCCTGSAEDTGVTVVWSNLTAGTMGPASQRATYCWLFGYFLCGHEWSAAVPLVPGANEILITASDPAGNVGYAPITLAPEADTAPSPDTMAS